MEHFFYCQYIFYTDSFNRFFYGSIDKIHNFFLYLLPFFCQKNQIRPSVVYIGFSLAQTVFFHSVDPAGYAWSVPKALICQMLLRTTVIFPQNSQNRPLFLG